MPPSVQLLSIHVPRTGKPEKDKTRKKDYAKFPGDGRN